MHLLAHFNNVRATYALADYLNVNGIKCRVSTNLHGGKVKNDKIDSLKIAKLVKGGNFPLAFVYPSQWRPMRDLLRRRQYLVRLRSEVITHIQIVNHQLNLKAFNKRI